MLIPKETLDAMRKACSEASDELLTAMLMQFAYSMMAAMSIGLMNEAGRKEFFDFMQTAFQNVEQPS